MPLAILLALLSPELQIEAITTVSYRFIYSIRVFGSEIKISR